MSFDNPRPIFVVQLFQDDRWHGVYLASFLPDAVESYERVQEITETAPIRLVRFLVSDFDFVAVHSRDFAVLRRERH